MTINWYPGHMTKARRMIEDSLKQIDAAVEILDARIPLSSRNPDITRLLSSANKPELIILNKSDLADPAATARWTAYYKEQGHSVLAFTAKSGGASALISAITSAFSGVTEKNTAKGQAGKPIKIMMMGIPNSGKSTIINTLCGQKRAKTEDRPGVTRGKQWISAGGLDIYDTPGILWPRLDDQRAAVKLAITGAIKDEILDTEELSLKLLSILSKDYFPLLAERYKLTDEPGEDMYELLRLIGKKRGYVVSGGEINTERTAIMLIDEFRGGKIGRITLDRL